MLGTERLRDGHRMRRLKACRASDEFAKVSVVGRSDHVLDDYPSASVGVVQQEIGTEPSDAGFGPFENEVRSNRRTQIFQILRQLWVEMSSFVCPNLPDWDTHQAANRQLSTLHGFRVHLS